MPRFLVAPIALACAVALAGCRDFSVPPKPPEPTTVKVGLAPTEAFGEQVIALTFDGKVNPAAAQVTIGGQLATISPAQDGNGRLAIAVPRLEGTCVQDVSVSLAAPGMSFSPAVLRYLGVGHPGTPRPVLLDKMRSVDFIPSSLIYVEAGGGGGVVASAYGEAAMVLDNPASSGVVSQIGVVYRRDFLLTLASPGSGMLFDVLQHGQTEQLAVIRNITSNDIAAGAGDPRFAPPLPDAGGEGPVVPPDLSCLLPSALSQPPSLAVLTGREETIQSGQKDADAGTTFTYRAVVLANVPTLQAFVVVADAQGLSRGRDEDLTNWMNSSSAQATTFDGQTVALFGGGSNPWVRLVELSGKNVVLHRDLAGEGDEWNLTTSAGSANGWAAGYLQTSLGLDGKLVVLGLNGEHTVQRHCTDDDCSGPGCPTGETCVTNPGNGSCACSPAAPSDCSKATDCDLHASCATGTVPRGTCGHGGSGTCECLSSDPCEGRAPCAGACSSGIPGVCTDYSGGGCSCVPVSIDVPCGSVCGSGCAVGGQIGKCTPGDAGCDCLPVPPEVDAGVPDDASVPEDASAPEDAGVGLPAEDAGTPAMVELPVHGAPLVAMTIVSAANGATLSAVDGASSFLYQYAIDPNPQTGELRVTATTPIPLPEPGVRVASLPSASGISGPGASILVVGRSGRLFVGPFFSANRLRLGLTSVAPLLRSSCEAPQAVVSAGGMGATVLVPTSEGLSAFLEGAPNARFADSVGFARDGGAPLAYFFSGGIPPSHGAGSDGGPTGDLDAGAPPDSGPPPAGFMVSQTAAQIYDLVADGGLEKKTEFHFSARAGVAVQLLDGQATLVVGGPDGIRFVALKAGELPKEEDAELDVKCPEVRSLAPLHNGAKNVLAVARKRLCLIDADKRIVTAQDVTFSVAAAAPALTREDTGEVQHLYTAGWEIIAGAQSLVLRHSQGDDLLKPEPAKLDWGSRVQQLLPTGGAPITAMAASPDGRRLLIAFAGEHPGLLAIDPTPFVGTGSEAAKAAAVTTLPLGAAPVGIGFTVDGAMAVIALSDDTLAFVR